MKRLQDIPMPLSEYLEFLITDSKASTQLPMSDRDMKEFANVEKRVWERVMVMHPASDARHRPRISPMPTIPLPRFLREYRVPARGAIAAILILALIGTVAWQLYRPSPVNAQALLKQAASATVTGTNVRSFHYIETSTQQVNLPDGQTDTLTRTVESWGALPNRWRTDARTRSAGNGASSSLSGGSDGSAQWSSATTGEGIVVQIGALPGGETIPLPIWVTLDSLRSQSGSASGFLGCYTNPQVVGESIVMGRHAYEIDLGPSRCVTSVTTSRDGTVVPKSLSPPEAQGKHLIWIDKETSFFLKLTIYNPDGIVELNDEVTQLEYNLSIPTSVFAYMPPAGAVVTDLRPNPYSFSSSPTISNQRGAIILSPPPRP